MPTDKLPLPFFTSLVRAPSRLRWLPQRVSEKSSVDTPYKTFFDNAVEGIFQTSPDGHYLQANPKLASIYGFDSPAEMIAGLTDIGSQLYVDARRRTEFRALLQSDDVVMGFESQVRRKDGKIIWISENARAIRTADDRLIGYEGTVLDITDRKTTEEELARTRARERATAAKIQQTLLLGAPPSSINWLNFSALTIASQHIGGDFYDFHAYDDHYVDILFGDAMGKGIPAALLGAAIKSRFLRAIVQLASVAGSVWPPEPEDIIGVIHSDLTSQFIGLEFFATLCYLRFDRHSKRVTYVDCGHAKTIHWQARSGECSVLEGEGMPLGFSTQEVYKQNSVAYEPGDMFVCYSDGITESAGASGEIYGAQRLATTVASAGGCEPAELIEEVRREVIAHSGNTQFADDLTIVVIRVAETISA